MSSLPATFAAGCFWGTEHFFVRHFADALVTHRVGYMGGRDDNHLVTYPAVKTGTTGHAEVLHLTYNPEKIAYDDLLAFFFRMHNSTTLNRQEGDRGTQYRSAIFYHTDEQRRLAEAYMERLNGQDEKLHSAYVKAFGGGPCVTSLEKAGRFHDAEDYHQNYLEKSPDGYCAHRLYF